MKPQFPKLQIIPFVVAIAASFAPYMLNHFFDMSKPIPVVWLIVCFLFILVCWLSYTVWAFWKFSKSLVEYYEPIKTNRDSVIESNKRYQLIYGRYEYAWRTIGIALNCSNANSKERISKLWGEYNSLHKNYITSQEVNVHEQTVQSNQNN